MKNFLKAMAFLTIVTAETVIKAEDTLQKWEDDAAKKKGTPGIRPEDWKQPL